MDITVRSIGEDEALEFQRTFDGVFGNGLADEDCRRFLSTHPLDRTFAAFDGDAMVGTSADLPFEVTVPGGMLPMAGLTVVAVRPTHRRRGVMSAMLRAYTDAVHERGDPLGGLWAAEAPIYGRFGFGSAVDKEAIAFDGRRLEILDGRDLRELALLDLDEARNVLPGVYDQVRLRRPGMLNRSAAWWEYRHFFDPEQERHGASANRFVVAYDAGEPCGYVVFRQKPEWDDGHAAGTIRVTEVIAVDGDTERALWHFLSRVDLFPLVAWDNAPVEGTLAWIASDSRRVERKVSDSLWLRLFDIPAALAGRRYRADGRLVLEIGDEYCSWNEGCYELIAEGGAAECRRTEAVPDLVMTAATLAALYLGGRTCSALADARLVAGEPRAVDLADGLFRWDRAPWCAEIF